MEGREKKKEWNVANPNYKACPHMWKWRHSMKNYLNDTITYTFDNFTKNKVWSYTKVTSQDEDLLEWHYIYTFDNHKGDMILYHI